MDDDGAVSTARALPPLGWLNLLVKVLLVVLLLLAAFGDLEQFEGKATGARALTYPLAALVVPAAWWARGRRGAYPHDVDVLLVLPFLLDTLGNHLDLYDTVSWWDDANHLVNWGILTSAAGRGLLRSRLGALTVAGLALGFGAVTAVLWELAEYVTFIRNSPELETAYTDTLGDLTLGLTGSALAAALAAWTARRRARPSSQVA